MHAILFCNAHAPLPATLRSDHEYVLLPVLNRPLAWHLVEQCMQAGATRITFVAETSPDALRTQLDNGLRWGVDVSVTTPTGPHGATVAILAHSGEDTLVFPGCWLYPPDVLAAFTGWTGTSPRHPAAAALYELPGERKDPARQPAAPAPYIVRGIVRGTAQEQTDIRHGREQIGTQRGVLLHTLQDIYHASMDGLAGALPWLTREERETQPGVHVGHHATIHPGARLIPPVIVGSFASIDDGCVIGPFAVVGNGCVIDREAELVHSVIDATSYAGPLTFREHSFSVHNMLIRMPTGECVLVPDEFLQGAVQQPTGTARALVHRGLGLVLAILMSPVLLAQWLAGGCRFTTRTAVGRSRAATLDCALSPPVIGIRRARTGTPVLRHLPALLDVVAGRLALVGPEPLSPEAAAALAEEWERLRLAVEPGFFPPWAGLAPGPLSAEERGGINAWYARHAGIGTDARVLLGLLRHGWGHLRHA